MDEEDLQLLKHSVIHFTKTPIVWKKKKTKSRDPAVLELPLQLLGIRWSVHRLMSGCRRRALARWSLLP